MGLRVRRVLELVEHDGVGILSQHLLGLLYGAGHASLGRRQNDPRAEDLQELPPLHAHRFGHGQDQGNALGGTDERQTDAGIAAGGSTITYRL